MTVAHPPISSGIPAVDRHWGGFVPGQAYLLTGRAGAGRSGLSLQAAQAAVEEGVPCLLISPREPNALVEIARGVGMDLPAAHASGALRILRIPDAATLASRGPAGLEKSYRDLVGLVEKDRPGRVVIEDFTPLVQFDTFERFHDALAGLADALGAHETTLVLGLGDPANDASRRLVDVVESVVRGTVRLGADGEVHLALHEDAAPDDEPADEPPADEPPTFEAADLSDLADLPDPEAFSTRDGASVDTQAPAVSPSPAPEPPADPFATLDVPPPAPAGDEPPQTEVVPPPAPDPSLMLPADDLFGLDPVSDIMDQGYLADSAHQGSDELEVLSADSLAPEAVSFPLPPPPSGGPPAQAPTFAPLPAFAPLGGAPASGFRPALDAAFAAREAGTPFLVVAIRMEPSAPEAAHFDAVEAGLRGALRPGDEVIVDGERKRAVVVLPSSGPEAGQALFEALQAHLRSALGAQADGVLRVVAAVTIPDGQPFQTPADLLAYAYEN